MWFLSMRFFTRSPPTLSPRPKPFHTLHRRRLPCQSARFCFSRPTWSSLAARQVPSVKMLRVVVMLVAVAGALVSATPVERIQGDEPADISSMENLVQTLKEVALGQKAVQDELMMTLQNIVNTQANIQRFLVGSNEVDFSSSAPTDVANAPTEDGLHYFTASVVAALNSGNNTQLSEILSELKQLNKGFKEYFSKVNCPEPFVYLGDECFNFQLEDLSWEESRQRCLRMGADLAEPKNLTNVRLHITENFPRKSRRNFWIGGVNNNKVWEWLSGNPVLSSFWNTNEPSGNGECLAMFDGWEHPLTDFPCENPRRAVCERKTS